MWFTYDLKIKVNYLAISKENIFKRYIRDAKKDARKPVQDIKLDTKVELHNWSNFNRVAASDQGKVEKKIDR